MSREMCVGMVVFTYLAIFGPLACSAGEAERLTLSQAIRIALEKSPLVQAARHQVEASEAGLRGARSHFLPKLEASEGFHRSDNPVFVFGSKLNQGRFTADNFELSRLNHPDPTSNFQTSLSFAQPLFTGGKASLGFQQARLQRDASGKGAERQRQEVISQVAEAYDRVLLAREQVEVAGAGMKAAEANLALAKARFEAGLVVESDVLSAQVRLAVLKEQRIAAEHGLILARAALNDAMGLPLEEEFIIAEPLDQRPSRFDRLEGLPEMALEERPDYQQLFLQEKTLEKGVSLAKAEFLPTVSAVAAYEVNNFNIASNGQDNWSVGVVLQWNLFNGFADKAKLDEARAQLARLQALRARAGSGIRLEVKEAFLNLQTAKERIIVTSRAVSQAEEALRIVRDRYEAGLTTIVDLLGNEAALTQAKGNLAQALYAHNVSVVRLELALGTLDQHSFER